MAEQEPLGPLAVRLYDELRRLARARLAQLPPGQTLQPTSLVNEVFIKLSAEGDKPWQSEAQFFGAAAEAMRRVLVDYARRKHAQKRGGGWQRHDPEALTDGLELQSSPARVLDIDEALQALEAEEPDLATIVKLRVFSGLSTEEIGSLLGIARKTVERRWRFAAATLRCQLADWNSEGGRSEPRGDE